MRLTISLLLALSFLAACTGPASPTSVAPTVANPTPASAPTIDQLAAATYSGIRDTPVTLSGGRWADEPVSPEGASRPEVILVDSIAPSGDLDGDGAGETVALLVSSDGGTGSISWLAVMKSSGSGVENVATAPVGDRVQTLSLSVENGRIGGVFVQTGEGEAMCCPTAKVRRSWALDGTKLAEQPAEPLGTVSIADLAGSWALIELPRGAALPAGIQVTLELDGPTATGSSGCNRYDGSIEETSPRELKPGLFAGTQMFCEGPAMEVERAYLAALGSARQYSFLGGRLAITYGTGDALETMLFARRE